MEQQTSISEIKNEAARGAKTRHFPILDLGVAGKGFRFSRFSTYYVEDRSLFP